MMVNAEDERLSCQSHPRETFETSSSREVSSIKPMEKKERGGTSYSGT